jgi:glycosyltransferase involved in cell wall biosynthesis
VKVMMLNTFDQEGGAARAATRLLKGLPALDVETRMLVQFKSGVANDIVCNQAPLRRALRRLKLFLGLLPVRRYAKKPENNFSPAWVPDSLPPEVAANNYDIIHLHWLCASFLSVETIGRLRRLGRPLVWTLHDSWAFTGGCHVPYDCTRYQDRCGACPVLGSSRESDLSRRVWERKSVAWRDLDLTVVTPSRWLADCARSSSLYRDVRVEMIPNGLDSGVFAPVDKTLARRSLGLPADKKIILFGAVHGTSDRNKGFHLLLQALRSLDTAPADTMVCIFGSAGVPVLSGVDMPVMSLGHIDNDRKLAEIYSAADVFVVPSILENLPNTVMEAISCATPCVAFDQGGLPDLIEHRLSGYLAHPYDTTDLARGIRWVLKDEGRRAELGRRGRLKVKAEFTMELACRRYVELYRRLLQASGSGS